MFFSIVYIKELFVGYGLEISLNNTLSFDAKEALNFNGLLAALLRRQQANNVPPVPLPSPPAFVPSVPLSS